MKKPSHKQKKKQKPKKKKPANKNSAAVKRTAAAPEKKNGQTKGAVMTAPAVSKKVVRKTAEKKGKEGFFLTRYVNVAAQFLREAKMELINEAGIPKNYKFQCGIVLGHRAAENKFSAADRTPKGAVNFVD